MPCETFLSIGAVCAGNNQTRFRVWAPARESVELQILQPRPRRAVLMKLEHGYFEATVEGLPPGSLYRYVLDHQEDLPDPASRFQPHGVHGPSQVVDSEAFRWTDGKWRGRALDEYVIYELHVGAFTPHGTFDSAIPHLNELKDLGVTAVEIMPVAQFPGSRNWGYDGVFPFAVQNSYGGPEGLKRFVNACHERELAAILDVVYNHLGHEGNYLRQFGPYFTDQYRTPWGQAVNFDGPNSDEVVRFFIENALYWFSELHMDALRLDAIHGITDRNARPFLQLLAESVEAFGRQAGRSIYLVAESDLNDARFLRPADRGGYGLHAQWSDDFHHALHCLLTGERSGYYRDFGGIEPLAKAFREGYVYSGQYSAYRLRRHGNSSKEIPARQFVVFAQNHDQVGNRMLGDRMTRLTSFEGLKLAAGAVILSPFIPLLFMGEEYGEVAPFQFFTSFQDPALIEGVRKGRREEFAGFGWQGDLPDPQAESTFFSSKLRRAVGSTATNVALRDFYRELIRLRKECRPLALLSKSAMETMSMDREEALILRRRSDGEEAIIAFNFGPGRVRCSLPTPPGKWAKLLDSAEARWLGSGSTVSDKLESFGTLSWDMEGQSLCVFGMKAG
jgi:maltooligosyltrehalose trehalohydrolase